MEPRDGILDGAPEGYPFGIAIDDGIPQGGIGKGQGVNAMPSDQRLRQFRDLCFIIRHGQPSLSIAIIPKSGSHLATFFRGF
jgi:hypothetical protein